ncbi:DUF4344 domain-containing metallopeptidase [Mycolicibacterium confluentis]|uniref:Uncharacterized protein n=1 Tax=Mycolicibacterium confluentis TaxID=28047 RepID=A0A7I7XRR2_9MYCO|nr:DUF4344 domain-containing metallopeptidase [Mycolicibacterium confluentis]MCV7318772.1 DUF4344 domain-containing metallopeptidase [Mycolicibacterium confluentis]ORV23107.1 hypothetical protein AWB99_24665 [Mycolicibacterium confluentis]BBZ31921.1 hypothetical protein MCNF_05260 [Mycolicibacterium confluentis]
MLSSGGRQAYPGQFLLAVGAIAALLVGCGSNAAPQQESSVTESPAEVVADTEGSAEDDDNGSMVPEYEDATTAEARNGKGLMERLNLLEDLSDTVNGNLKLPFDVPLKGSQCDEPNDYWSPDDKEMVLCYEDVDESLRIFGEAGDPDPEASARRVAIASFFHELGHMAIDLYDLPATGREEDAADQMAAFWLLTPDSDGYVDPDLVQAAKDQAREYRVYAQEWGAPEDSDYADVHTLNQARMFNFECWIYGSDPDGNQDIVDSGLLPQARADRCEDEYNHLVKAWGTLLEPHIKD